jgi:hypothetical protein
MEFPIDSYDLKARYAPGLLLALPVLITLWTCFNKEIKDISTLVGILLSAAITYGLSVLGSGQEFCVSKRNGVAVRCLRFS